MEDKNVFSHFSLTKFLPNNELTSCSIVIMAEVFKLAFAFDHYGQVLTVFASVCLFTANLAG